MTHVLMRETASSSPVSVVTAGDMTELDEESKPLLQQLTLRR